MPWVWRPKSIYIRFTCHCCHIVHPLRSSGHWRVFAEPFPQTILSCPWRTRKLQQQKIRSLEQRKKHRIRLESDKSWPVGSSFIPFHSHVSLLFKSHWAVADALPGYSLYPNPSGVSISGGRSNIVKNAENIGNMKADINSAGSPFPHRFTFPNGRQGLRFYLNIVCQLVHLSPKLAEEGQTRKSEPWYITTSTREFV